MDITFEYVFMDYARVCTNIYQRSKKVSSLESGEGEFRDTSVITKNYERLNVVFCSIILRSTLWSPVHQLCGWFLYAQSQPWLEIILIIFIFFFETGKLITYKCVWNPPYQNQMGTGLVFYSKSLKLVTKLRFYYTRTACPLNT